MTTRFSIAGELFNSKSALIKRVQGIIATYDDRVNIDWIDFQFMLELLELHPRSDIKIGTGVESIHIAENPIYPGRRSRGFILVRADGTFTDFSYRECVSPSSQIRKVKSAFRQAIQYQSEAFKRDFFYNSGKVVTCPETGEIISYTNSHVDHVSPRTFETLMERFIQENNIDVETILLMNELKDNLYIDELADKDLEGRWQVFHACNAVFQVISPRANLSTRRRK